MPGRPPPPRSHATWPKWSALALRLVLLVAAWQGPIPWCHGHAGSPQDSPAWLVEHLHVYHGGQSGHWEFFGWHLHADFLRSPAGADAPPRGASPPEFPINLVAGARAVGDAAEETPWADWARWVTVATGGDCIATQLGCVLSARPSRFFDSYDRKCVAKYWKAA